MLVRCEFEYRTMIHLRGRATLPIDGNHHVEMSARLISNLSRISVTR
jgi:hypothetical protein